ncbi:MAG TPA: DUF4252 domain-containing protein [Vicinamibacterales bacterium]|jgi:hypothetical protein|nr:DUF4252 domain-containing protein [Vicinamibacterales bacterium]
MKTTLALVAFTLLVPVAASAQGARLNLSFLDRLGERATEKQEITIDRSMLSTAGSALVGDGPNSAVVKQLLSELEGVYVRSYEFDDQKAFSMDDILAIRKQLAAPGWSRIVANEEKDKGGNWELQEIWLFNPGGKVGGIFIINAEPGELQVVNIIGPIDLLKLRGLGGVLGIPRNIGIN